MFSSYNVEIPVTSGFAVLHTPDASREVFQQHLNSFNEWSLVGMFVVGFINPLECRGNYSATLNNMKLVH